MNLMRAGTPAGTSLRLAVVSDIHGNLPALQAVLDDVARRGCDLLLDCGDRLSGPLWPAETARLLRSLDPPAVCGNHDRQLLACAQGPGDAADMLAYAELDTATLDWLRTLPPVLWPVPGVAMVHGRPDSDLEYLLETVTPDAGRAGVRMAHDARIRERLRGVGEAAQLVLCGHSHQPRVVRVDSTLVVNPGSVGLPAFDDTHGGAHCIECGSPHARYALCERRGGCWSAALIAVDYDWEAATARALQRGMPDWAGWLRTGRACPP